MNYGPTTSFSQHLHATKYRGEGESFPEYANRVASALAGEPEHFRPFREVLRTMRFLPGGRVQSAIGSSRDTSAYNCFVSASIGDKLTGEGSIMQRAQEAARTMQLGGGIGYDFSTLRPRGDLIRSLGSRSSGPISFMGIFDAICGTIASAGHRRGAQMAVLRVDHPDIEEFIRCKQNQDRLTGFNISVGITDEFMEAVRYDNPFELRFNGTVYRTVRARDLWETIMRSTWEWAEPGVLFIDRINGQNNLWYCEEIAATNPCGEQPLPPNGACLLGSFNLTKYLTSEWIEDGDYGSGWKNTFDFEQFREDIPVVVRAMDRVIDVTNYPLASQEAEAKSKRRMGLGVCGLANTAEVMGMPYGSEEFLAFEEKVLRTLRDEAYLASALLAQELGAFPEYRDEYLSSEFLQDLPDETKELISRYGIRNSHLTSIAPTGTISLVADNVSSGIEPVYLHEQMRTIQTFDGPEEHRLQDWAYREHGVRGRTASEVSAEEHIAVLTTAQRFMDSSVSNTCNVSPDMPWEDFKQLYFQAYEGGAKGCTTFNPGGKRFGIIREASPETSSSNESCKINPETGERSCGD